MHKFYFTFIFTLFSFFVLRAQSGAVLAGGVSVDIRIIL